MYMSKVSASALPSRAGLMPLSAEGVARVRSRSTVNSRVSPRSSNQVRGLRLDVRAARGSVPERDGVQSLAHLDDKTALSQDHKERGEDISTLGNVWRCAAATMLVAAAVHAPSTLAQGSEAATLAALETALENEAAAVLAAENAASFGSYTGVPYLDAVIPLTLLLYATIAPGVGFGFIDAYILAPLDKLLEKKISEDNVRYGLRMGDGTFGTVYSGTLNDTKDIIIKRAKKVTGSVESAIVEEYMNRRIRRSGTLRKSCAPYIGSYMENGSESPVLVWDSKGAATLEDLMSERDFPLNCEEALFGKEGTGDEVKREVKVIQRITSQILEALKGFHDVGIVHRDVKPSNIVLMGGRFRFIDFGAATDLRVGFNYDPEITMLDPGYAPPEQYVMPEKTPKPPPAPVAAALSPFLWQFNRPDLFDTYSLGIILLRMGCPTLRAKNAVAPTGIFQRSLASNDFIIRDWRNANTGPAWDFSLLDAGGGWDLVEKLICKRNYIKRGRWSAQQASLHPFVLLK